MIITRRKKRRNQRRTRILTRIDIVKVRLIKSWIRRKSVRLWIDNIRIVVIVVVGGSASRHDQRKGRKLKES